MSGQLCRNESVPLLSPSALARAVALRDLTDPSQGNHAMQLLVREAPSALVRTWGCALTVHRAPPVVTLHDNYDALLYPPDGAARDARYTRYASSDAVLRTQTSAMIPALLRARAPHGLVEDELLACPGLVYRRDRIDRTHVGEPHQLDLWRLVRRHMTKVDLEEMVAIVLDALLPGRTWRTSPTSHPYTVDGLELEVRVGDDWVEVGECGIAHPGVLSLAGVDTERVSGLAMGLGLDRVLMTRKLIPDIRILRSLDPRISTQMKTLGVYTPVSALPPTSRDLSIVVDADVTAEELGDRLREGLSREDLATIEDVEVLAETTYDLLPPRARTRLRLTPSQKNVLLRLVLRHLERTLTAADGNGVRDRAYALLHEGEVSEWAG